MPLAMFAPTPMAVLAIRRGESLFLGMAALGAVLCGLLLGPPSAVAYLFVVALPALLIGRGLAFDWAPEKIVGIAAVILTAVTITALEALAPGGLRPWIAELVTQTVEMYRQAGAPPEMIGALESRTDSTATFLYYITPMAFMWSGMGVAAAGLLATRAVFQRQPHPAVTLTDLTRWSLPDSWIWGLIGSAVLLLLPVDPLRILGGNVLGILSLAYAFQGWAVMVYVFRAKQVHIAVQAGVYVALLLWPVLAIFLVGLGVFDLWTDVRRVRQPEPPAPDTPAPPDDT